MDVTRVVDIGFVLIANAINLLLILLFWSRPGGRRLLEKRAGLAIITLAAPVALGIVLNAIQSREWWTTGLPSVLLLYLVAEFILDYVIHSDFRQTRMLWPYLLLFYLALNAMIGYSFLVGGVYGAATLVTYFCCLLATWYSFSKVGHGKSHA